MPHRRLPTVQYSILTAILLSGAVSPTQKSWAQSPAPEPPTPLKVPAVHPEAPAPLLHPAEASKPPTLPPELTKILVVPVLGKTSLSLSRTSKAAPSDEGVAEQADVTNEATAYQASNQSDKFQKLFEGATKIFGNEHTVISPSFFYATDINGRLSTTDKHLAGVSAVLLLPLFGLGGGHGADWWPVVTSEDETKIYQEFSDRLDQYQDAIRNAQTLPDSIKNILETKWNAQKLMLARQLVCQKELDLPPEVLDPIKKVCGDTATSEEKKAASEAAAGANLPAPKRHQMLLGPSLGIPLTENPVDIFQLGAAVEIGGDAVRFMATGGLVGHYQGATYKDIFGAGWFVGLALSGEIGDKLFHFFNGGSDLLAQLAKAKSAQP